MKSAPPGWGKLCAITQWLIQVSLALDIYSISIFSSQDRYLYIFDIDIVWLSSPRGFGTSQVRRHFIQETLEKHFYNAKNSSQNTLIQHEKRKHLGRKSFFLSDTQPTFTPSNSTFCQVLQKHMVPQVTTELKHLHTG